MIVREVQRKFRLMREADKHPPAAAHPNTPVSEIIARAKPSALTDNRIDVVAWFAQWLLRWSFRALPNEHIRDFALDLALQKQSER